MNLISGLSGFVDIFISFPTIIFSFLLCVLVFYWMVVAVGLVDTDVLDIDLPSVDVDIASADAGDLGDADNLSFMGSVLFKFGLYGVPVTLMLTFIVLFAWLGSFIAESLVVQQFTGVAHFLLGLLVFFVALAVSIVLTGQVIRPLRPLFKTHEQSTIRRLVGQTAVVRTSTVTEDFGEANVNDGGAGLVLKVRAIDGATHRLGDEVVLTSYDERANTYQVVEKLKTQ